LNEVAGVSDGRGGLWVLDWDFSMVVGNGRGKGFEKTEWMAKMEVEGWREAAGFSDLSSAAE
jgi:hypothetical protein